MVKQVPHQTGVSPRTQSGSPSASWVLVTIIMFGYLLAFVVFELVSLAALTFGMSDWMLADAYNAPKNFAIACFVVSFLFQAGAYFVAWDMVKKFRKLRRGSYSDVG